MKRNVDMGNWGERENHFYHVCTDGMSRAVMFRDDYDYICGMNDIPLCSWDEGIEIYCFCLMSNHVHFILNGNDTACMSFIRKYKRLRSIRSKGRYGTAFAENSPDISLKRIDDTEYLMNAMAYVMRNPLAAGVQVMPCKYPWGSASLYFSYMHDLTGYRKVSGLKKIELRRILKTRTDIPEHYLLRHDGLIWPGCYVEYKSAEKIFGSPRRLLYYLSKNQDMENEIADGIIARTAYSDTELSAFAISVCMEKFRQNRPENLSIENRYLLARELRRRYGASARQIARVIGLDASILKSLL